MPTLNKLEYLDETKQQIKSALNTKFNSGITDDDTFRSYVTKINNIYTNWPKVTGEGTNITLSNTKKGKMTISPKGNSEQDTLTGKNLFNINGNFQQGFYGDSGVVVYSAQSVSSLDYIPVEQNKSYICSYDVIVSDSQFRGVAYYDENKNYLSRFSGNSRFTIPANCAFIRVYFYNPNNMSVEQLSSYIQNIQIEQGSTATSYEPFVGGSPSPSPDYPQDIKVVKGNNTITISDGTNTDNYPLNLGSIELCKIGDYQDYIYKENNKWYKHSEIGKVVLDGSEDWMLRSDVSQTSGYYTFRNNDYVEGEFNTNSNGYSNYFGVRTSTSTTTNHIRLLNATGYGTQICIDGSIAQTSQALKTWLSTNNVEVYYIKITPTDEEITDTDLIGQLEQAFMSYDNPTNITSTYATGNSQIIISASALKKGGN